MKLLVTGGAGFIGSNFVHLALAERPDWEIVNLDKLTYAGNLENLKGIESGPRYRFVEGDICDSDAVAGAADSCDAIINFAAETHVDRSIMEPMAFLRTDMEGTFILLQAVRDGRAGKLLQVSTDEVYGSIPEGAADETYPLRPSSPYSASKAGADLLCLSYWTTYRTPVVITRGANTIGPYQYPEKVLPLFVTNALDDIQLPLYGDGLQVRDYTHVEDHCRGILLALEKGEPGEVYNIGAGNEMQNIDMARFLLAEIGKPESLIEHVKDRPGHDRRYALDAGKLRSLGWEPRYDATEALRATVQWYAENRWWWEPIKSGDRYKEYYRRQYEER
ncbi:MAG TPA: dTDP-glucose 4,6-dehydratase [Armatimonadota bacterium]|nr:dTDP-glucose 4,6-dehydratase [Armatimonadota bacterium]